MLYLVNKLLATKPRFAIIGTGRCGTGFSSKYLTSAGVPFSHERYYTVKGPILRNGRRSFRARGDASWLAVPFLPDPDVIAIHQVRNPLAVILSFYNIGFFDPNFYETHDQAVDLARKYFEFSEDPLRSSLRWYLEWNYKCEQITSRMFRVEHLSEHADDLAEWLEQDQPLKQVDISTKVNTRPRVVDRQIDDVMADLETYPEFSELKEMAERYGYEL